MKNLTLILLAAGCSSRLGQPKQLVPIFQRSLLRWQCQQALSVTDHVICVTGYQANKMAKEIDDLEVTQLNNPLWSRGLSSSIAQGIAEVGSDQDGALLLLVDQWRITIDDLKALIATWQQNTDKIVVAKHGGVEEESFGPPVIFPKAFFGKLLSHTAGDGAKKWLTAYPNTVTKIELLNAASDLDTPEHLTDMQQTLENINE